MKNQYNVQERSQMQISKNVFCLSILAKKENAAKRAVLIPMKIKTILGSAPPYSSKILFPEAT